MGVFAMVVYLGCYTDASHVNGLKVLEVDPASGRMEIVAEREVGNAIYQSLSPDGRILYTCTPKGVASFAADGAALEKIDDADFGASPCHVAAMPDGKRVAWADYCAGVAGSVAVSDGRFGEVVRHVHSGSGPNLPRQDKAHCHQTTPTPDGRGYVVSDLGLDELVEYPSGRIFKTTPAGAGPRHIIFHPNGRLAFEVFELGNMIASLRWSAADGFSILDAKPTLPPGDTGRGYNGDLASAIRFTPDMKRVVASNRGENSLVSYDYDENTGALSFKARSLLPGSWPRDFAFVSDDAALVAMERSGEVHLLAYDPDAGSFAVRNTLGGLFRPVALLPRQTAR